MKLFLSNQTIEAEAGRYARSCLIGTRCRATALLRRCARDSKMCNGFRKVRILENPDDFFEECSFFEDAHIKLRTFAARCGRMALSGTQTVTGVECHPSKEIAERNR